MTDDRVICLDCANRDSAGVCTRALALRRAGVACDARYHPIPNLPRRCGEFAALRRPGKRAGEIEEIAV